MEERAAKANTTVEPNEARSSQLSQHDEPETIAQVSEPSEPAPSTPSRARAQSEALGPATDNPMTPFADTAAGSTLSISLMLITGARHPYKIDEKYLRNRQVTAVDADLEADIQDWKDEAGNEHPDGLRKIEGELKPSERWQPKEPEPIIAVFGLRETDADPRPWRTLLQDLQARAQVRAMAF